MSNRFLDRRYPKNITDQTVTCAQQTPGSSLLEQHTCDPKIPRLCFITDFNHCAQQIKEIIKEHWPILQMEPVLNDIINNPPLFALRRASTLRDKLVHSSAVIHPSSWLSLKGNFHCGHCAQCNNTTNCKKNVHIL